MRARKKRQPDPGFARFVFPSGARAFAGRWPFSGIHFAIETLSFARWPVRYRLNKTIQDHEGKFWATQKRAKRKRGGTK